MIKTCFDIMTKHSDSCVATDADADHEIIVHYYNEFPASIQMLFDIQLLSFLPIIIL